MASRFNPSKSPSVAADGDPIETCAIVTIEANELLQHIHDRMPVILAPGAMALFAIRHVKRRIRMDAFSTAGPAGDALAALALVRALIRKLHEAGKLSENEVYAILNEAIAPMPQYPNAKFDEAKRLINEVLS
jgi:hypothetical protein